MDYLTIQQRITEILHRIAILMQNGCITSREKNELVSLLAEARRTKNFEAFRNKVLSMDEPEDFPNLIDELLYYTCDNQS